MPSGGRQTDPAPPDAPGTRPSSAEVGRYSRLHAQSLEDPVAFWSGLAREQLLWDHPFTDGLDWKPPFARWFPDGALNASVNCLDRHLNGPVADRVAYFWEGEDGGRRALTYRELHEEVGRIAGALERRGFGSHDRAAVYLPMVPELPVAMLALARLGIAFTVVFSGFSAPALAERMNGLDARLLITADGGYRRGKTVPLKEIADEALRWAPNVRTVALVRRTGASVPTHAGRDVEWSALRSEGPASHRPRPFRSDHPLFLLYSSGTTGSPKAIVHSTGGYLTHVAATTRWVFDPRPSDVYWCAADIGWVTGHSYIVFGPLLHGMTSLLYEGALDFPTPDRVWEMIARYHATILYTSPTALRSLRKSAPERLGGHDLTSLRLLGTVGEAINPAVWEWYRDVIGGGRCPIVDTWWQTETGGAMLSPAPGVALVPLKAGSATFPLPGIDAEVVDDSGRPCRPNEKGVLVIRRPWPGMLLGLFGEPERYRAAYWTRIPGAYYAGDYAVRDEDGYFFLLGRADEVLKVAGHRLGTIEIEDALLSAPEVAEAAVCGLPDDVRGEVPVAFVVLRAGVEPSPRLSEQLAEHVSDRIGRIARPAAVYLVRVLPKTRSGKILRRVVRAAAEGRTELGDVSTLEDGLSVEELRDALRRFEAEIAREKQRGA